MSTPGGLVVLRGNSGSGKSTVAEIVQQSVAPGACLVVAQETVRREMLGEPDIADAANIELMETIAGWGLARGLLVIVEGILNAGRYQRMLERLQKVSFSASFFTWDLPVDETIRRHAQRAKRHVFNDDEMRSWYHGWQPLDFTSEVRFDESTSADEAAPAVIEKTGGVIPR
jgi:predicted ABC-type ATPase